MVHNYEYERYFTNGSHHKHLLIVEQDATVTAVYGKPPKIEMESGDPIVITNDNILKEKFELEETINSADNWSFGSVEPSLITFSIREDGTIPYLEDKIFRLYLYFDGDSASLLYIGSYIFDQDTLANDSKSREISGFDFVQAIRDIDVIDWYRSLFNAHEEPDPDDPDEKIWVPAREKISVKEARDSLFEYLATNEGLPIMQEEVELPNDEFEFAFDVDTEALSAGQILEDLCEINGRFGRFGRKLSTEAETMNYQIFQYILIPRYDDAGTKIGNALRYNGMKKGLYETASIARLRVYNRESVMLAKYDEGWKKKFSVYCIYDNILIDDLTKNKTTKSALKAMMKNIYDSIRYRKYVPFESKFPANLCYEVGDRITLWTDIDLQIEGKKNYFRTLIFKRRVSGIQNMVDEYSAKGDKKLPAFGDYSKSGGYSTKSGGGSGKGNGSQLGADGTLENQYLTINDFVEIIRNIQFRLLDEPSDVSATYNSSDPSITFKWSDPPNISTNEPVPATWAGTVLVRSETAFPLHRWDITGNSYIADNDVTLIVNNTTRDQYKTSGFVDDTVEKDKVYYYGLFPYDSRGWYRPTKLIKIDTSEDVDIPVIVSATMSTVEDNKAIITYNVPSPPSGTYEYVKLVYKVGNIPSNVEDGTAITLDVQTYDQNHNITVSDIDPDSLYWFVIFTDKSTSEPVQLGNNMGSIFFSADFTSDCRDLIRYNADKTVYSTHKQGELYNYAGNPGYTISDGVLDVTSVTNGRTITWQYDPTDNPKSIPANCTLTFETDVFFPNGEGYLDWYVGSNGNLGDSEVCYFCFDTAYEFQANKWYNCKAVCKIENGKVKRFKLLVDDRQVHSSDGTNLVFPCTDVNSSTGTTYIYFRLTKRTKFKTINIYYDFSTYDDGGGGGDGSSGTSGGGNNNNNASNNSNS